jgi:hypothetical protein
MKVSSPIEAWALCIWWPHPIVKASKHLKNDAALKQLFLQASDPQEVFDHFLKEWKPKAIDGEGKFLAQEWRSPSPATDFEPNKWVPMRPGGHIDPSNFDGMDSSF